jgi:hypothetical protein
MFFVFIYFIKQTNTLLSQCQNLSAFPGPGLLRGPWHSHVEIRCNWRLWCLWKFWIPKQSKTHTVGYLESNPDSLIAQLEMHHIFIFGGSAFRIWFQVQSCGMSQCYFWVIPPKMLIPNITREWTLPVIFLPILLAIPFILSNCLYHKMFK